MTPNQAADAYSRHRHVIQALRKHGINPEYVLENGLSAQGYEQILVDHEGNSPVFDRKGLATTLIYWESPEIWEEVLEAMRLDFMVRYF